MSTIRTAGENYYAGTSSAYGQIPLTSKDRLFLQALAKGEDVLRATLIARYKKKHNGNPPSSDQLETVVAGVKDQAARIRMSKFSIIGG